MNPRIKTSIRKEFLTPQTPSSQLRYHQSRSQCRNRVYISGFSSLTSFCLKHEIALSGVLDSLQLHANFFGSHQWEFPIWTEVNSWPLESSICYPQGSCLCPYKLTVCFLGSTTSLENWLRLIRETWLPFRALQRQLCESFRSNNSGRRAPMVSRAPNLDKISLNYSLVWALWQKEERTPNSVGSSILPKTKIEKTKWLMKRILWKT